MSLYRISVTLSFFISAFLIQEALINQIDFFIGGFSLYLALTFSWIASEERSATFISAFAAGLLLDLTPSLDTPVGLWTFILLAISYLVSTYRDSLGDLDQRPITAAIYLLISTSGAIFGYYLISGILGNALPPIIVTGQEFLGNGLWTILFSPVYFPLVTRLRKSLFISRSAI